MSLQPCVNVSNPKEMEGCLSAFIAYPCSEVTKDVNHKLDEMLKSGLEISDIKQQVLKDIQPDVNRVVQNLPLIEDMTKLSLSVIDKYNCVAHTMNARLNLQGNERFETINRNKVMNSLGESIGCCGICTRNHLGWFILLGVLFLALLIFVAVLYLGYHRRI